MNLSGPWRIVCVLLAMGTAVPIRSEDWPMWRRDPNRTGSSGENLPAELALRWTRTHAPRVQVWDDPLNNDLMTYDRVLEPIVAGKRMFIGFNDSDKLLALDMETGRELWRFYAGGPIRLAPVAWQERVYFTSDDGHLYCVSAEDGSLCWKFRGAPSERKALGNRRLISAWPARGGPVIRDGTIYFSASIWPFMGTFLYALDAATGRIVWVNDGTGAQYIKQPHSAPAFAGVAPQGALVATDKYLVVPGGRSVPAVFDRRTGNLVYFHINDGGKGTGGSFVVANDQEFFVHTRGRGVQAFDLPTGKKSSFAATEPVLDGDGLFTVEDHPEGLGRLRQAEQKLIAAEYGVLRAKSRVRISAEAGAAPAALAKGEEGVAAAERELAKARAAVETEQVAAAARGAEAAVRSIGPDRKTRWQVEVDAASEIIRAGDRFYVGGSGRVLAVAPPRQGSAGAIIWSHPVDGTVARLLAANGYLFAVTSEGRILAFGAPSAPRIDAPEESVAPVVPDPESSQRARAIIAQAGAQEGYALCFGVGDGRLVDALLAESNLHIIAVDPDGSKVEALRRHYDAAGLYGTRVAVHVGTPREFKAPPYIASLVVVDGAMAGRMAEPAELQAVYESVRPYGGQLWISGDDALRPELTGWLEAAALPRARVRWEGGRAIVTREGALEGAADWTHQYGDVANTVKSDDRTVKLPLGVLWFGGNTHLDVLPRHGHGPTEQVVGGRLIIQGMDSLSARDVYTGRVLWKTQVPGLDTYNVYWDETYMESAFTTLTSQVHIPGANARGPNYVATEDEIYVVTGSECKVLDSRTGKITRVIRMPSRPGGEGAPEWGYLGVCDDVLLGGAGFAHYSRQLAPDAAAGRPAAADLAASAGLVAFDRHSGEVLWQVEARHSFWHNGIVAGNGRVYCLDRLPASAEAKLKRRGLEPPRDYRIAGFDLRTGRPLWETTANIFGSWLGYSKTHDLLLQAGASATDRLGDEAGSGMITYRGSDGSVVWQNLDLAYYGPCMLHNDLIITAANSYKVSSGAYRLVDGKPHLIVNPLTGKMEPWKIQRTYGCNYIVASEHLLTFRSGAAGFYDLETHAGTGNLGGFKSGCSPNLIVANGVLNAPDYTRTCSCAYQNQTSLAFVHMPELEVWTNSLLGAEVAASEPVTRLGLNLGAPGDRRSETGTLWLEFPWVGGTSPNVEVAVKSARSEYFLRHASQVTGDGPAWVVGSGARDIQSITIVPFIDQPQAAPPSGSAAAAAAEKVVTPERPALVRAYTVRLYFSEPDEVRPGERVFDVLLQGERVLAGFDIVREAGAPLRGVMREFRQVRVEGKLEILLNPSAGSRHLPVLSGVEMIAEESPLLALAGPAEVR